MIEQLKAYFEKRQDVAFVFIFGSFVKGTLREESDVDVGVYFFPKNGARIKIEEDIRYEAEDEVWGDVEKICGREIDLIVLNRAPASVCDEAIREGIPIIIKDYDTYLEYMLRVTEEAEFYRKNVRDIWEMRYGR
ncbi:MAG: nucleotidyltransferase domain-containing protein [Planctomycetes bacterium]|nr:nucleotidyltransferase domain-containing protein [Planctomycetota bacterium]